MPVNQSHMLCSWNWKEGKIYLYYQIYRITLNLLTLFPALGTWRSNDLFDTFNFYSFVLLGALLIDECEIHF